eukprot:GEMP01004100.1.p1 GENE.GEMP01004100.1~~GEMP01004100.1.p1  ORF type:complete len:738 (+),score=111.38 GEMP01004100.1:885-3098(+)
MRCAALLFIGSVLSTEDTNDDLGNVFVECEFLSESTSEGVVKANCTLTLAAPFSGQISLSMESCEDTAHLCAFVDCIHKPSTVGDSSGVITVNRAELTFDIQLKDPADNIYTTSGPLASWATWQVPRRVLSSAHTVTEDAVEATPQGSTRDSRRRLTFSSRFVEPYGQGRRSDCEQEVCPERWDSCWGTIDELNQIQVLTILEKKFCNNFSVSDLNPCILYVEGIFKDSNLVFESQLGIHLTLSYIITPDIVDKHFPRLANPATIVGSVFLAGLDEYYGNKVSDGICRTADTFQNVTGYKYDQFGFAHILTGHNLVEPSRPDLQMRGYAYTAKLCTCNAKAWTGYFGDLEDRLTWVTFAHEVGHLFGASHYWELKKSKSCGDDKTAGLMDCGTGKVNDVYSFNDLHKDEMCRFLRGLKANPLLIRHAGCMRPYFQPVTRDQRFGPTYQSMTITMALLVAVILIILGGLLYMNQQRRKERWRYDTLRAEIFRRRQVRKARKDFELDPGNSEQMLPSLGGSVDGSPQGSVDVPPSIPISHLRKKAPMFLPSRGRSPGGTNPQSVPKSVPSGSTTKSNSAEHGDTVPGVPVKKTALLMRAIRGNPDVKSFVADGGSVPSQAAIPAVGGSADNTIPIIQDTDGFIGPPHTAPSTLIEEGRKMAMERDTQTRKHPAEGAVQEGGSPRPPPRTAGPQRLAVAREGQYTTASGPSVGPGHSATGTSATTNGLQGGQRGIEEVTG